MTWLADSLILLVNILLACWNEPKVGSKLHKSSSCVISEYCSLLSYFMQQCANPTLFKFKILFVLNTSLLTFYILHFVAISIYSRLQYTTHLINFIGANFYCLERQPFSNGIITTFKVLDKESVDAVDR